MKLAAQIFLGVTLGLGIGLLVIVCLTEITVRVLE